MMLKEKNTNKCPYHFSEYKLCKYYVANIDGWLSEGCIWLDKYDGSTCHNQERMFEYRKK
jgi:hypothetical protein